MPIPVPSQREHLIVYVNVALLIVALLLSPISSLPIGEYSRLYVLGVLLAISFVVQSRNLVFTWMDGAWLCLIGVTWLSAQNAISPVNVWYGMMTTTYLYLCHKSFGGVIWNEENKRFFSNVLTAIWALSFVYLIYVLWDGVFDQRQHNISSDNLSLGSIGVNLHFLNCYVVTLTPFILFRKGKIFDLICPLALALLLYLLYGSGSVMAFLVTSLLAVGYVLKRLDLKRKTLLGAVVSMTLLIILVFSIMAGQRRSSFQGSNTVVKEFYSQKDRLWMWERSWNMFKEAPVLGHGKNNWVVAHGKNGYLGCGRCISRTTRFVHTHNAFFQVLSETGLLGLCSYLLLALGLVRPAILAFRKENLLAIAAATSLASFLVLGLVYGVVYNFHNNLSVLTFLMAFNMVMMQGRSEGPIIGAPRSTLLMVVLLVILITSLYTTYRFDQVLNLRTTARTQIKERDFVAARTTIQSALKFGNRSLLYRMLGNTYVPDERWKQFNRYYQQAASYDPFDRRSLVKIGSNYLSHEKYSLAGKYTRRALDLDPINPSAQKLLIRIRLAQKRYDKAIKLASALRERYLIRESQRDELQEINELIKQIRQARVADLNSE